MAASQSAMGTWRVPGRVRNADWSRWWWAFTSPGVRTQSVASSRSAQSVASRRPLPGSGCDEGSTATTRPASSRTSTPASVRRPVQTASAPRTSSMTAEAGTAGRARAGTKRDVHGAGTPVARTGATMAQ
jgi:hypothetical protein